MKMSEVIRTGFLYQHYILKYPIMSFFQFETENFVLWIAVCHIMLILMLKINFTLKNIIWKSINRIDGPKLDIQTNNNFLFLIFTACTKPPYNWKSFISNGMLSVDIGLLWKLLRNNSFGCMNLRYQILINLSMQHIAYSWWHQNLCVYEMLYIIITHANHPT